MKSDRENAIHNFPKREGSGDTVIYQDNRKGLLIKDQGVYDV